MNKKNQIFNTEKKPKILSVCILTLTGGGEGDRDDGKKERRRDSSYIVARRRDSDNKTV